MVWNGVGTSRSDPCKDDQGISKDEIVVEQATPVRLGFAWYARIERVNLGYGERMCNNLM